MRSSRGFDKHCLRALDAKSFCDGTERTLDGGAFVGAVLEANGALDGIFGLDKLCSHIKICEIRDRV